MFFLGHPVVVSESSSQIHHYETRAGVQSSYLFLAAAALSRCRRFLNQLPTWARKEGFRLTGQLVLPGCHHHHYFHFHLNHHHWRGGMKVFRWACQIKVALVIKSLCIASINIVIVVVTIVTIFITTKNQHHHYQHHHHHYVRQGGLDRGAKFGLGIHHRLQCKNLD